MGRQKKEVKRKEFVVRIGPELMAILKKQIESIKDVTYGVVGDSIWEAGEIIAKKYNHEV